MKDEKLSKREIIIMVVSLLITIAVSALAHSSGYRAGSTDMAKLVMDYAPGILDIELSPRALMVLEGNPLIVRQILTIETLEKLFSDLNKSANAKGGIGPGYFLD